MAKKHLTEGEARGRISEALEAEFGRLDHFSESVKITATGPDLARVVINVPSHSHDLRQRMLPYVQTRDQFGVKALVGRARFEIRARNLSVIVKAVEGAFAKGGKK